MSSAWELKLKSFSPIKEDAAAEVLVIGGGLAGIWHAYLLSQAGKSVTVIESKKLAQSATLLTTAFITEEIDTNLTDLIKIFDTSTAKSVWLSHEKAINLIEETIKKENIDCDFERTSVFVFAHNDDDFKILEEEYKAATKLGFNTVLKKRNSLKFQNCGVWEIKNQAKYHPLKFISGLIGAAERNGVRFYENTEAVKISGRGLIKVETKKGNIIKTNDVVICTYKPFNNVSTHFKKGMYVSYVLEGRLPKDRLPSAMYLDMKDPYNYFRIDKLNDKEDRIIFGGADHRAEIKMSQKKNFNALRDVMKELFIDTPYKITSYWRGAILEPTDGLALMGEIAPHQYVATAFSGNGMTYSPISALINRDLILGKKNTWAKIYNPKRSMKLSPLLQKAEDYSRELVGGAFKNIFK